MYAQRQDAENAAFHRLLDLMAPEERHQMEEKKYAWVDGKPGMDGAYAQWLVPTYKVLIPYSFRWGEALWVYNPRESLLLNGMARKPYLCCCVGMTVEAAMAAPNIPAMDFWISVYLHAKSFTLPELLQNGWVNHMSAWDYCPNQAFGGTRNVR